MKIQKYDQPTYGPTNGLTWVGVRDICLPKKDFSRNYSLMRKYPKKSPANAGLKQQL